MNSKVILDNKPLVSVSKDKKILSIPVPCNVCNDSNLTHSQSSFFKNPATKYWHIKQTHSRHHIESYERRLVKKELRELRELSEKNQRGLI